MHERSLALAIWKEVERTAREECARKNDPLLDAGVVAVQEVRVQVGPLSGVEPTLLAAAFDDLAKEGLVPSARLVLEPVEFVVRCTACGKTTASSEPQFRCKWCGAFRVDVIQGDGLILESIVLGNAGPDPIGKEVCHV